MYGVDICDWHVFVLLGNLDSSTLLFLWGRVDKGYSRKKYLEGEEGTFLDPTTHEIKFPQTPTTHVIWKAHLPTTHRIKYESLEGPLLKKENIFISLLREN